MKKNKELINIGKLNCESKEELLSYLLILEMQEKQDNQEPVFAYPQIDG